MTSAGLIWKNAWRRRLRTILTIVSIVIAFLIFGVIRTFDQALNAGVELAAADRLVVTNKINFTVSLPFAVVNKVAAIDGVKRVSYATWFGAYWQDERNVFAALAVDPESYLATYPELVVSPEARERFLKDRTGALVGAKLAQRFGWKPGDRIPLPSGIWSQKNGSRVWEVTIDGIFTASNEKADTNYMLLHYKYLDEARSFGGGRVGLLIVTTDSHELNDRVAKAIDDMFANTDHQTRSQTEQAFSASFIKQIGNIGLIVTSVVGAAFFTILIITGTTMSLAIRERIGEIAVLKTIGFTGRKVFALILGESFLLALLGGIPGLILSWLMVNGLKAAAGAFLPAMVFEGETAALGIALLAALGLVTGLIPALQAQRLPIVVGLGKG
ncbi:MAG: ABC transporter permease [Rhodothalassiaceae bacterium]